MTQQEKYDWGSILKGFDPTKETRYDIMALGALVHRLDPGKTPWPEATTLQLHASTGAEFNLVANCVAYGLKGAVLTGVAKYPIGDAIMRQIGAQKVDILGPTFAHSPWGPNHAATYSGRPGPHIKNRVGYNRSDEAALIIKPGMFNYDKIFEGGVKWVHTGGLYEALGEHAPEMMLEYLIAGKEQGAIASLDLNFRGKLITADKRIRMINGAEFINQAAFDAEYAQPAPDVDALLTRHIERTIPLVREVDVLFANETDIANCLGIPGNEGEEINPKVTKAQQVKVLNAYKNLGIVGTSLRKERHNGLHDWGAVATIRLPNGEYQSVSTKIEPI